MEVLVQEPEVVEGEFTAMEVVEETVDSAEQEKYCPGCGAVQEADAKFCSICGKAL